jgi:hypothetical protein
MPTYGRVYSNLVGKAGAFGTIAKLKFLFWKQYSHYATHNFKLDALRHNKNYNLQRKSPNIWGF